MKSPTRFILSSLSRSGLLLLLISIVFGAAVQSGYGQTPDSEQTPEQKAQSGITVRAMLLMPAGRSLELQMVSAKTASAAIIVGARGLSDPLKVTGRQFKWAMPDTRTPLGYREVANVALPETGDYFITLLEPQGEHFNVHVINGKDTNFGKDTVIVFNATPTDIGIALGEKRLRIPPRKPTILTPPKMVEQPFYQVQMFQTQNGKFQEFASTRWPYRSSSRSYIFVFTPNGPDSITWQAVDETIK